MGRSTLHTIMMPVRDDGRGPLLFAHAAVLAKRYNAHVRVVHCQPRAEDMLPYGVVIPAFLRKQLEEATIKRAGYEHGSQREKFLEQARLHGIGVEPRSFGKPTAAFREYVVGGTGTGQEDSIVFAALSNAYDLKLKYIPFYGGGAVAAALAGQQIMATVNNPAEARGFYQSGDVRPMLVFSDAQMEAYPGVPTLKEKGHDFSYYNQRAVVGAPGMSDEAAAYYQKLFTEIYNSEEWQEYLTAQSLSSLWLTPDEQRAYWKVQVANHTELLAGMK